MATHGDHPFRSAEVVLGRERRAKGEGQLLHSLPVELIQEILDIIQQDDPMTLLDIACVSRDLHVLALGYIYRCLSLTSKSDVQAHICVLEKYDIWRCVRTVQLGDNSRDLENAFKIETGPMLPAVAHLIENSINLSHLTWCGNSLPPELWKAFLSNPACPRLYLSMPTDVATPFSTFTVAAPLSYLSDRDRSKIKQLRLRLLDSSSPQSDAALDIISIFDLERSIRIAPFTSLTVVVDRSSCRRLWSLPEIDQLVRPLVWSQLRTLTTDAANLAISLVPNCPQLHCLCLRGFKWRDLVATIGRCNSLVRLEWMPFPKSCWRTIISDKLALHGKSLKHLSISWPGYKPKEPILRNLDENKIRELCNAVPNLETLVIDMYRDGSWPIDELRVIGSLENLVTLDVILNLLTRDKKPAHPFLNTNSARELLHCVNSGMTRKKSPLELFQIETGAPAIPEFSSTPVIRKQCDAFRPQENMYTQWVRSQSEMICVRPSGRSEMTWTAGIDVHCPALDQVERKLRRRGIPMEQWIENDEYSRRKRRADIGPINYEEWEAENEKQAATGEKYSL